MNMHAQPRAADHIAGFLGEREAELTRRFLNDGYVIEPVADRPGLDRLRAAIAHVVAERLGAPMPDDVDGFLNQIHQNLDAQSINPVRLAAINGVNDLPWARRTYFELARPLLETLVGNELAMQRRLNLSIQLPGDDSSLLAVHADSWDGDSPFEVVVWLPLVDCFDTKTMFLLPPDKARAVEAEFARFDGKDTDDLFHAIESDLVWLDVPYGTALLFNQNLMHGNRVNREGQTRWSMNCRFKSLFSPYAGKRLGEFFEPITMRAASRVGMTHEFPGGFDE
jgi:sporadic carbohydrate cluster 2OG-Fe(II) oxygenase